MIFFWSGKLSLPPIARAQAETGGEYRATGDCGQGGGVGVLQTLQIVTGTGYRVVVSPGVRHLPELLSVRDITGVHGDIRTTRVTGMMEIQSLRR